MLGYIILSENISSIPETQKNLQKPKNKFIWTLIKILIAVVLLFVVISKTSIANIVETFKNLDSAWFIIYCGTFYLSLWVMARRYWILIGGNIPFRGTSKIIIMQVLIGNLIATSLGAVYFVTEFRQKYNVKVSRGLTSLVFARICDFILLLVCTCLSGWVLWEDVGYWHKIIKYAYILSAIIVVIIIASKPLYRVVNSFTEKYSLNLPKNIRLIFENIFDVTRSIRQSRGDFLWTIFIQSIIIMILMFIYTYASLRMFSISISPWYVLLVMALQQMVNLVPVQVIGGLGIIDLMELYLYGFAGISPAYLASIIVSKRIFFILINSTLLLTIPINAILKHDDNVA